MRHSLNTFFMRDHRPLSAGYFFRVFPRCARSRTAAAFRVLCVSDLNVQDSALNVVHIFYATASRLGWLRNDYQEIADLLGHRNIDSTSFYVKVAVPQLADVSLPFPGGAS